MFKKPGERSPLLHILERIAGKGWLLADHTIQFSRLETNDIDKQRFRAYTDVDSAEFEYLEPEHEGCFGALSSNDLQWTKADIEQTRDAAELDAMRCYALMSALEQYIMAIPYWRLELSIKILWFENSGYSIGINPPPNSRLVQPWIFIAVPKFEVQTMLVSDR
jgi:hypothetical protein